MRFMTSQIRTLAILILFFAAPCFAAVSTGVRVQQEEIIAKYSSDIAQGRSLPCAYHRRGMAYAALAEYALAISDFEALLTFKHVRCRNEKGVYGIDFGVIRYHKGLCWYNLHEFEKAIESFNDAVGTDGYLASKQLYFRMGESYGYLLKWKDAIAAYTQAISMDPKYAEAYYARGLAYGRIGVQHKERQDKSYARYLDPDLTSERDWEICSGLAMAFGVLSIVFLLFRTMTGMLFKTTEPVVVKGRPSYFMCFLVILSFSSMLYFWLMMGLALDPHLVLLDPQGRSACIGFFIGSLLMGLMYLNLAVKEFVITETGLYLSSIFWLGRVKRIELDQIREIKTIRMRMRKGPNTVQFHLKSGKRYQVAWLHDADGLVDQVKQLLQGGDAEQVAHFR